MHSIDLKHPYVFEKALLGQIIGRVRISIIMIMKPAVRSCCSDILQDRTACGGLETGCSLLVTLLNHRVWLRCSTFLRAEVFADRRHPLDSPSVPVQMFSAHSFRGLLKEQRPLPGLGSKFGNTLFARNPWALNRVMLF